MVILYVWTAVFAFSVDRSRNNVPSTRTAPLTGVTSTVIAPTPCRRAFVISSEASSVATSGAIPADAGSAEASRTTLPAIELLLGAETRSR